MMSEGGSLDTPLMLEWGMASAALPGQDESGDRHVVQAFDGGVLIAVVDGLGHGSEAALAAKTAVSTLHQHAHESVIALTKRCHEELRASRGAVMSLGSLYARDETLTWLSVGNVEAMLVHPGSQSIPLHKYIVTRGGVIGYSLPDLHTSVIPVVAGDTIIFATDGIRDGFANKIRIHDAPRELAEEICRNYAKEHDDALVLVVQYKGVPS